MSIQSRLDFSDFCSGFSAPLFTASDPEVREQLNPHLGLPVIDNDGLEQPDVQHLHHILVLYRKTRAFMHREEGREPRIFCWLLLLVVDLANLHETRNQVHIRDSEFPWAEDLPGGLICALHKV
jgi:hypothetical protein